MKSEHDQLVAYVATLVAIVVIVIAALLVGAWHPEIAGKLEVFGLGTVLGGLIGVLRYPSQRAVSVDASSNVNTAPEPQA